MTLVSPRELQGSLKRGKSKNIVSDRCQTWCNYRLKCKTLHRRLTLHVFMWMKFVKEYCLSVVICMLKTYSNYPCTDTWKIFLTECWAKICFKWLLNLPVKGKHEFLGMHFAYRCKQDATLKRCQINWPRSREPFNGTYTVFYKIGPCRVHSHFTMVHAASINTWVAKATS